MLKEMNELNMKVLDKKQKYFEDHLRQLTEQTEKDTAKLMAEQEMVFNSKLQEQEEFFNEKISIQNKQHQEEIRKIKMKKDSTCSFM